VDRANYGRMKPIMTALEERGEVELLTVCAGTMLLERFGRARDVVERDGFRVDGEVYLEVEGSVPITMAKSVGLAVIEFASEFQRLGLDFVLVVGDRYETMAAAIAATFQNICLIHVQGGEVSGSIDESARHAITKLAHYHFPATTRAGEYVERLGEHPDTIFPLGCPSRDVVDGARDLLPKDMLEQLGVGPTIDFEDPYLQILFHPVTTDIGTQEEQIEGVLQTLFNIGMQSVLLWPNIDAGADRVSKAIRRFREYHHDFPLHAYKNLPPDVYIPLLNHAACCVGNSSSFVRETSFLGTPVVLVGSRQDGREWSPSVIRVAPVQAEIEKAVRRQLEHGKYPLSDLYGRGQVGKRIAEQIGKLRPYAQKRLDYVFEAGQARPHLPLDD
jgi:UDP-hydrolysing UDP-N-acetyl-D-glucosamine 2-epimerase